MSAALKMTPSPDPMALVRAIRRMEQAGFALSVEESGLAITPASQLNEQQRAFLRTHKAALIGLLTDAETLADALDTAGTAGLAWREGIPDDWDDDRAIAANEVLYRTHRQIFRLGRHYATAFAPPRPDYSQATKAPEIVPVSEVAA